MGTRFVTNLHSTWLLMIRTRNTRNQYGFTNIERTLSTAWCPTIHSAGINLAHSLSGRIPWGKPDDSGESQPTVSDEDFWGGYHGL